MNLHNWRTQLRKGLLNVVVLNLLSHGQCHGYEMVQKLKQIDGLKIREGNIYPILARMLTDGLIKSRLKTSIEGPERKYYQLTKNGQEALTLMNEHWTLITQSIEQIKKGDIR